MAYNIYSKGFEEFLNELGEVGYVSSVATPIVLVEGLPGVHPREVIMFENGDIGYVTSLSENVVELISLAKDPILVGTRVVRTNQYLEVPVGDDLLGSTLNSLGHSIYETHSSKRSKDYRPVEVAPKDVYERERIVEPLETGVILVDMLIPLGRGQRELVIGDRKTGKTEFLLQTLLTQAKKGTVCIYAAIGKKKIDIKKIEDFFVKNGISGNAIVVCSSSSDPLGMIYLTPYTAMTMAEYFRDMGRNVLLILDDLTTHAKFYREMSLLAKKFPGRSSYPGDIFYTHSRLLERAGSFKLAAGGIASISCLIAAETVEGDISGYIQTNLMSITDGHIYFDKDLFAHGRRPAVNYFLSVTRVGRQTQSDLRWGVNRELNSFLSLYEKTQSFVHFGSELNEGIKSTLSMGDRVLNFFDQPLDKVVPLNLQIVIFSLIWLGAFNNINVEKIQFFTLIGIEKYKSNESFRLKIDDLTKSATSFNSLLKVISTKQSDILELFEA